MDKETGDLITGVPEQTDTLENVLKVSFLPSFFFRHISHTLMPRLGIKPTTFWRGKTLQLTVQGGTLL